MTANYIIITDNTRFLTDFVTNIIQQSEQRTQVMLNTFSEQLSVINQNFTQMNARFDKMDNLVQSLSIQNSVPVSNAPVSTSNLTDNFSKQKSDSLTKKSSGILSNYRHQIRNVAPSIRITFKETEAQVINDVILPKFRMDSILMSLNLINVVELNRSFLLTFKSQVDLNSAKAHIQDNYGDYIIMEEPKAFKPSIKIAGLFINKETTPEQLNDLITNFNPNLNLNPDNFKIKQVYHNGVSKSTMNALAEVDINAFVTIMKKGSLFVNMRNCSVFENFDLLQCSKCQSYGHIKKFCKNEHPICGKCSGTHFTNQCTEDKSKVKCINCVNLKNETVKIDHHTQHPLCYARKLRIKGIKDSLKSQIEDMKQKVGGTSEEN